MKKFWPAIFIVLCPYAIIFANENIIPIPRIHYAGSILFLLSLIYVIYVVAAAKKKKWDPVKMMKMNIIIKLLHIPVYVLAFVITVFSVPLSIHIPFAFVTVALAAFLLDAMMIALSGTFGVAALRNCCCQGLISPNRAIMYGVLQYLFCVDIPVAIVLFIRTKAMSNEKIMDVYNTASKQVQSKLKQGYDKLKAGQMQDTADVEIVVEDDEKSDS